MNFGLVALTVFLLTLFPVTNYGQVIGIDTAKFIGLKSGKHGSKERFEKSIIVIYPDSTFIQNQYHSVGTKCKLNIDMSSPIRTYEGYWTFEKGNILFYRNRIINDSNLIYIFKVKSNQLNYKFKKTNNRTKKYWIHNDAVETFDKIYGTKPIIHFRKVGS
ncbi:MAG: hypothetical protein K9J13_14815 [Saprospiraceae bacterium]|nr:hypothetical protein [Saprospiraceae bacterium]